MTITVAACYIYPLKSGRGIEAEGLTMTPKGPLNDRMWMLVEGASGRNPGKLISQREYAQMVLIDAVPDSDGNMAFQFPDRGGLSVNLADLTPYPGLVNVWGSECPALDAGDTAAQWFSDILGVDCRLVKMPDDHIRETDPNYTPNKGGVSFADEYPVLITGTASLEALKAKTDDVSTITMRRFRPNIVLDGLEAFEEDTIHRLAIGDAEFEMVKPCVRCIMTTVNPETGTKSKSEREPIKTLTKYRRGKADGLQGVFFGQRAIPLKLGQISVGDEVKILSRRQIHPAVQQSLLGYKG